MSEATVGIADSFGEPKVVMDSTGKILEGGHDISQNDFHFMESELREQFNCLSGRLYGIVDAMMVSDKQNIALKRLVKREVWERFNDFVSCMEGFSKTPYNCGEGMHVGMPLDEVEAHN